MRVIIVGCGKVGKNLAKSLQEENTEITLIDINPDTIEENIENIDALGVVGNGASIKTLVEAGIDKADILIAVTVSDELNLLCCLIAQKGGNCQTIARVRNPIYNQDITFLKERLGITMIINPELAAAQEISRLLRFPVATKIDTFERGKIELIRFKVKEQYGLIGRTIEDISTSINCKCLISAIIRDNKVIIPNGQMIIQNGDELSLLSTPEEENKFFYKIGLKMTKVHNCLIVGGGTISYYLAKLLTKMDIRVKIIEIDKNRCEELANLLPKTAIINGDGTNRELLMEEGLKDCHSFVALTNLDEENVFLSLFAKKSCCGKIISKVNRLAFDDVIDDLDVGSIIYPKYLTSDLILQKVRALQNTIGSNVETLYHIVDNRAEALSFKVKGNAEIINIPISRLKLKDNLLIGCITRNETVILPNGNDVLMEGDAVIVVTTNKGLQDITDIIKK